jgi:hypothetical protein
MKTTNAENDGKGQDNWTANKHYALPPAERLRYLRAFIDGIRQAESLFCSDEPFTCSSTQVIAKLDDVIRDFAEMAREARYEMLENS